MTPPFHGGNRGLESLGTLLHAWDKTHWVGRLRIFQIKKHLIAKRNTEQRSCSWESQIFANSAEISSGYRRLSEGLLHGIPGKWGGDEGRANYGGVGKAMEPL